MGIPNEIKIGILGAGGKMGMRISANLKKLPKHNRNVLNRQPEMFNKRAFST
jgi:dihydrodipicolinate reductase